jgi:hypothetical protein
VYFLTPYGLNKWDLLNKEQVTQLDNRAHALDWSKVSPQWMVKLPYEADEKTVLLIDNKVVVDTITINPTNRKQVFTFYDLSEVDTVEAGRLIHKEATLAKFYLKDSLGQSMVSGKTILKSLILAVNGGGTFSVVVKHQDRGKIEVPFSPIGVSTDYVGELDTRNIHKYKAGIRGDATTTDITLESDSVYRLGFIELSREGVYYL